MLVPIATLRPIVEDWIQTCESKEQACQVLAAASGLTADAWRKRLSDDPGNGWWRLDAIDEADVDDFLSAADLTHLWGALIGNTNVGLRCEDCNVRITEETGYRPLDLLRPDPSSTQWVWDSTKKKLVHRPKNARVGGRRFHKVDLCRRCAAEALRVRAQPGYKANGKPRYNTIKENGVVRFLRPTERIELRRGGRPRLLDEPKLRALHAAYGTGLSIRDLTLQLIAAGHPGTEQGLYQSMLYGWRNLGLPIRSPSEAIRVAHHRRGRMGRPPSKKCAAVRSRGKRCGQWARVGHDTCVWHAETERLAA